MSTVTPDSAAKRFYERRRRDLGADPSISEKKMFGTTALCVDGKVFMFQWKDALVLKIPAARVDELLTAGQAELFDPGHGRTSKTWAAVFPSAQDRWPDLAEEARAFVRG
jgi:TfoX/Sxy family transcriptional regulator of competence genes